ncbi:MAG: HutD family protein [Betaproteobacteria bacterium]
MILVSASDTAPVPWKNGGGVTRELLCLPRVDGAPADWGLRISVADIDADGPFSPFPGITRWFAVLAGAGVRLRFRDRVLNVTRGDPPLCFDGADAPDCQLIAGSTRDLNVMVRADWGHVSLATAMVDDEATLGHSRAIGLFALRPLRLHAADTPPLEMPALSLAWADPSATDARAWWLEEFAHAAAAQAHTALSADAPSAPAGYWIRLGRPTAA